MNVEKPWKNILKFKFEKANKEATKSSRNQSKSLVSVAKVVFQRRRNDKHENWKWYF